MKVEWFDRLSLREKRLVGAGAVSVLAFAAYMLTPVEESAGVELVQAPAAVAPAPATPAPTPVTPAPQPLPAPTPAQPETQAPAPPSAEAFVLTGLFGGGPRGGSAILLLPGGQQRRVPVGREIVPGVTLKAIGLNHVVVAGPDGESRLELRHSTLQPPVQVTTR